ncbi:tail fiber assembly protein [Proteus terrae]|uniref:tail fiber assembly protein n=1 Tax=Proteus terrae TaxID=1574161 RepID=UPI0022E1F827|nr:tail fiber assembly protein [Proteus terrae]
MSYFYSALENAFYPESMKDDYIIAGTFPNDAILVDENVFEEFSKNPPDNKIRISVDGLPAWGDKPQLTKDEMVIVEERKKASLISEATSVIDPMSDAKNGGYIEKEDIKRLDEWQRYRYALTKIDTSLAPDIDWPQKPD